jgi:hypothetical protein
MNAPKENYFTKLKYIIININSSKSYTNNGDLELLLVKFVLTVTKTLCVVSRATVGQRVDKSLTHTLAIKCERWHVRICNSDVSTLSNKTRLWYRGSCPITDAQTHL